MKKERDWIDYANLASNVAQNLQLIRANQTLAGLERVSAERAVREQEQRDQERQLDRLREHVSQIADDVASLKEHLHENPSAALTLALQIKDLLEKHNVTTASFRQWEDKDRLKDVQRGLESVLEESTGLLTDSQKEEAVKCATYLTERDALDQLIGLQRKKEVFDLGRQQFEKKLAAKKIELINLKREQVSIRLPFWQRVCTLIGGLGLAFSAAWLLGLFMSQPLDTGDFASPKPTPVGPPLSVPGWMTSVVFVTSLILSGMALTARPRLHQRELAKQAESLEIETAKLQTELDRFTQNSPIIRQQALELELGLPDFQRRAEQIEIQRGELSQSRATQQRWDKLIAMFGAERAAENYETMKREREAFIQSIFGGSETKSPYV